MSTHLNTSQVWEALRSEWEPALITPITQQSAHLTQAATIVPGEGEFVKMQTRGTLNVGRRKKMYELKDPQEIQVGERRFHPVYFGGAGHISQDVLERKGSLPIGIATLQDALMEASAPHPDRVFLGVEPAEKDKAITMDGNCVICAETDKSIYKNDDTDMGMPQGLMGVNLVGKNGEIPEALPQQPLINGATAGEYDDYKNDLGGLSTRGTNVVPVNYVSNGTPVESGLTVDKLQAIPLFYADRNIAVGTQYYMAITPRQAYDLITSDKLNSQEYGFQLMKDGYNNRYMTSLLGITFLITPDVPIVDINPSGTPKWVRACPVWRKQDVEFATWSSLKSEIEKVPLSYDEWVVSVQFAYGAGRRRLNTVLTVHCAEAGLAKYTEHKSVYVDKV